MKPFITLPQIVSLAVGIALIVGLDAHKPSSRKFQRPFVAPPENVERFTFGYNESTADSFWLRLIQDIDHCEKHENAPLTDEVDAETAKKGIKHEACSTNKGWVFQMLNAITEIAPLFRAPYSFGATVLSVIVDDIEGAKIIFERGIERFPHDWSLEYRAAYHYMDRVGDLSRAAELLNRAGKDGAPGWVFSLAAKLYTKEGKDALARSVIKGVLDADPDSRWAPRLQQRLDELDGKPVKNNEAPVSEPASDPESP